jgi:hypothetical protein
MDDGGHSTRTLVDAWGRTVEVHGELDPWIKYYYNTSDQLTQVKQRYGKGALQLDRSIHLFRIDPVR